MKAVRTSEPLLWKADLTKSDLEPGWYHKNTPVKRCYTLDEKPGHLRVYGNCYDLASPESPALLLRKQTSYNQTFCIKLDFRPTRPGYEAGGVLWWNQYSYASIGVAGKAADDAGVVSAVAMREPAGKPKLFKDSMANVEVGDVTSFTISIQARPTEYTLSLTTSGRTNAFTVPVADLTVPPPVGGSFTGIMFGIYSFGQGEPVLDPADFSEIAIREDTVNKSL
ncbi:hypothetical protein VTK73DRAFT_9562 [Phialemonium thermophilum]|uniref:Beta-xylosidase C-terminal Concanavalin A-like domain-containing protein n=1 Tax=Phialemonium thermophilum TaxID=223376 RepID=A0ABR3W1W1_9PEZI